MTADESKARDRTQTILDRANEIDNLVTEFITELRVHVDLLRDEIDSHPGRAADDHR